MDKRKYIIIGGGIAGMTIADELVSNGHEVEIYEKNHLLGGQCEAVEVDGLSYDRFYHVFYTKDKYTRSLLKKLNLDEKIKVVQPSSGYMIDGKFYPLNGGLDLLLFPKLSLIEKFKLGYLLINGFLIKNWKSLENMLATEWITSIAGQGVYSKFWQPMLRTKFREGVESLSAVDIWTRINRLLTIDPNDKMCYLQGKLKLLIDTYEKHLINKGVKIFKNTNVEEIITEDNTAKGIIVNGQTHHADRVIMALPTPAASKLVKNDSEYFNKISEIKYIGNVCLTFITKEKLNSSYMTAIDDDRSPFTAIMGASNLYPKEEFNNKNVFYLSHYFLDNLNYFKESDDVIRNDFFAYLKKIDKNFNENDIENSFVSRVRFSEPLYTRNFESPTFNTSINNLFLVTGSQIYPKTPVINTSIKLALDASAHILKES